MSSSPVGSYRHEMAGSARRKMILSLLFSLVVREIKGRYRRSLLGPAWAVLQPLAYMVVFTFLRGVLNISSNGIPYAIFTYSALVPWTFFANGVSLCGPSVLSNAGIVKKMAVPREVFPGAAVLSTLVDFVIAASILLGMMIYFHYADNGWQLHFTLAYFWLPVLLLLIAALTFGLGLGVAALGTYKRDVMFAIPFVMQFWLLATPIMYPLGKVPGKWLSLYSLNPMVGLIEGCKQVLLYGQSPDLQLLGISILVIALVWSITWPLFRYMSQYFADVL